MNASEDSQSAYTRHSKQVHELRKQPIVLFYCLDFTISGDWRSKSRLTGQRKLASRLSRTEETMRLLLSSTVKLVLVKHNFSVQESVIEEMQW